MDLTGIYSLCLLVSKSISPPINHLFFPISTQPWPYLNFVFLISARLIYQLVTFHLQACTLHPFKHSHHCPFWTESSHHCHFKINHYSLPTRCKNCSSTGGECWNLSVLRHQAVFSIIDPWRKLHLFFAKMWFGRKKPKSGPLYREELIIK